MNEAMLSYHALCSSTSNSTTPYQKYSTPARVRPARAAPNACRVSIMIMIGSQAVSVVERYGRRRSDATPMNRLRNFQSTYTSQAKKMDGRNLREKLAKQWFEMYDTILTLTYFHYQYNLHIKNPFKQFYQIL